VKPDRPQGSLVRSSCAFPCDRSTACVQFFDQYGQRRRRRCHSSRQIPKVQKSTMCNERRLLHQLPQASAFVCEVAHAKTHLEDIPVDRAAGAGGLYRWRDSSETLGEGSSRVFARVFARVLATVLARESSHPHRCSTHTQGTDDRDSSSEAVGKGPIARCATSSRCQEVQHRIR
jgi:hypothetical protein